MPGKLCQACMSMPKGQAVVGHLEGVLRGEGTRLEGDQDGHLGRALHGGCRLRQHCAHAQLWAGGQVQVLPGQRYLRSAQRCTPWCCITRGQGAALRLQQLGPATQLNPSCCKPLCSALPWCMKYSEWALGAHQGLSPPSDALSPLSRAIIPIYERGDATCCIAAGLHGASPVWPRAPQRPCARPWAPG